MNPLTTMKKFLVTSGVESLRESYRGQLAKRRMCRVKGVLEETFGSGSRMECSEIPFITGGWLEYINPATPRVNTSPLTVTLQHTTNKRSSPLYTTSKVRVNHFLYYRNIIITKVTFSSVRIRSVWLRIWNCPRFTLNTKCFSVNGEK